MAASTKDTSSRIITLTTDFGRRDHYVAAMKGVILSIAPTVRIVDVTHEIEPHNVIHGAFILRQIWPWYPPDTIHLAVVDPGVGSDRRIILGRYDGRYLIAPDNGLVTFVHRQTPAEMMHVVEDRRYFLPHLSATFHGRDIMAPAAAHLASGVKPRDFGRATDCLEVVPVAHRADKDGGVLRGTVLYADHFGNLVTNIGAEQLPSGAARAGLVVFVDGGAIGPIRSTFCDVPASEPIALIGSGETLEIAVNCGNAVERFGPAPKVTVKIE